MEIQTGARLNRIDCEHRDLYLSGARGMALSVEPENTLWAATNHGLVRMEKAKWEYIRLPRGIQLTRVTTISVDDRNGVWLSWITKDSTGGPTAALLMFHKSLC